MFFVFCIATYVLRAQCYINVSSSRGYTASIVLEPDSLIKPSTCPWGYNFTVRTKYSVSFSGRNIPSNLNTLNAYLHCGTLGSLYFAIPKTAGSGQVTSSANIWNSNSDCSSSTLQSLGCDSFSVQIQGPGISNRTVSCSFSLPVGFYNFSARRINEGVRIDWSTSFEHNNQYFIIQRSRNGTNWENIDTVLSKGNSNQLIQYYTMDKTAKEEEYYYQIKQVDFNGRYSYTMIRKVAASTSDEMLGNFDVFPNPSEGKLIISGLVHDVPIQIFNMSGSEVHNYTIMRIGNGDVVLDLGELKHGVYLMRILQKNLRVVLLENND